eukprot:Nitzschia sp. Nitz4//scaffold174_size87051//55495//58659//NITZ4_005116-RA/size87051-processed-gene-0.26-mRNA-1//1//CDS//3329538893//5833//frame0
MEQAGERIPLISPITPLNDTSSKPGLHQPDQEKQGRSKLDQSPPDAYLGHLPNRGPHHDVHPPVRNYDSILESSVDEDPWNAKTWSRIVVEKFLSRFRFYYPTSSERFVRERPSLAKAWAYYEHVALPRRCVRNRFIDGVYRRAVPGAKQPTELYDPFRTPQSVLIEFGTGVDQYFASLRVLSVLLFVAGLINLFSMFYYHSEKYNGPEAYPPDVLLTGSAVCTNTAWAVCPSCQAADWMLDKTRYATDENGVVLVLRNRCHGAIPINGITNFVTLIFLIFSLLFFSYYLHLREIRLDEDTLTSTDYSIVVENPPPDAVDPDEWRTFFEQFTQNDQVSVVTVALDNENLLRALMTRRKVHRKLRLSLPEGVPLDNLVELRSIIEKLKAQGSPLGAKPLKLVERLEALDGQIKHLQSKQYHASKIFVTFETEVAQRLALESLSVGKIHVWLNNTRCLPSDHVFRAEKVLHVKEPCESDAVRWLDLSAGSLQAGIGRLMTLSITLCILVLVGIGISKARSSVGPSLSGPLTSISNMLIPHILKGLMKLECHPSEGNFQTSMYLKITLFRWTLTAILARVITPFTSTLSDSKEDLLPTVSHILLADLYVVPIMKILNIGGNIKKHILGPRARTQEEMDAYFHGNHYNLGERYTDMTKVLFVVFFYSSLYPAGFFIGAAILAIQRVVDKFSLMRIWGWSPLIGSQLAVFSRRYFFTAAVITLAVASSYTWAQLPYDNICADDMGQKGYAGMYHGVTTLSGELVNEFGVVSVRHDQSMKYCSQSWTDSVGMALPHLVFTKVDGFWSASIEEQELPWMTPSQSLTTVVVAPHQSWMATLYGWVAFVVVAVFGSITVYRLFSEYFLALFFKTYKPDGDCQHIDFGSDPGVFAYVPQVKVPGYHHPLLACNVDAIDHALIGWWSDKGCLDDNNLIFDVPHPSIRAKSSDGASVGVSGGEESSLEMLPPIFSIVKQYPTSWQHDLASQNKFVLGKRNE